VVDRAKGGSVRGEGGAQQQRHEVLREHVWAKEVRLRGARAVIYEAGARVGLEEARDRAGELVEVADSVFPASECVTHRAAAGDVGDRP
jgi:hypothetical protein